MCCRIIENEYITDIFRGIWLEIIWRSEMPAIKIKQWGRAMECYQDPGMLADRLSNSFSAWYICSFPKMPK